ncbi:hypothetical protein BJ684DRAFT_17202 [Piptocephalis cylindrospora]|uniref:Uncharacterized protein n=1 Tax=Piptocephalis cylindrospora TaxID=1907219 RepID=A0A4P9Y0P0_9FUNG|nr:hypothetical protein BJ684DRAFT_17202 [Piptocephalis cylindrospora]|eukprot:RKP12297.1 hypothetical protein BJ684DRAFT_17202 [Piptocephalis cylindrospora]
MRTRRPARIERPLISRYRHSADRIFKQYLRYNDMQHERAGSWRMCQKGRPGLQNECTKELAGTVVDIARFGTRTRDLIGNTASADTKENVLQGQGVTGTPALIIQDEEQARQYLEHRKKKNSSIQRITSSQQTGKQYDRSEQSTDRTILTDNAASHLIDALSYLKDIRQGHFSNVQKHTGASYFNTI